MICLEITRGGEAGGCNKFSTVRKKKFSFSLTEGHCSILSHIKNSWWRRLVARLRHCDCLIDLHKIRLCLYKLIKSHRCGTASCQNLLEVISQHQRRSPPPGVVGWWAARKGKRPIRRGCCVEARGGLKGRMEEKKKKNSHCLLEVQRSLSTVSPTGSGRKLQKVMAKRNSWAK